MIPPEMMRRIREIELRTRRQVQNTFAGAYQSIYKGRGMSFASVRPYIPGDDVRVIDWKVTARYNEPYIKEFEEERELTLMLVIDGSASVLFGTQDRQKRDAAAELGAVLALAANKNNDRSGLIIFSDHVEHYIPPKKGRNHILRLIRDLLTVEPANTATDMTAALQTVNRVLDRGAIVFLISDFMMPPESYAKQLQAISQKHETIAVVLTDPLEQAFPEVGMMVLRDAETGAIRHIDTSDPEWRQRFKEQRELHEAQRNLAFQKARVARIDVDSTGDYIQPLSRYFRQMMGGR